MREVVSEVAKPWASGRGREGMRKRGREGARSRGETLEDARAWVKAKG